VYLSVHMAVYNTWHSQHMKKPVYRILFAAVVVCSWISRRTIDHKERKWKRQRKRD